MLLKKYKILLIPVAYFLLALFSDCSGSKNSTGEKVEKAAASGYKNPVFNHDFPDPNIEKGKDGFFYAYSTEANWDKDGLSGGRRIIPILRSRNLVDWEVAGSALAKKPDWKKEGGIWAPDVTLHNGKYYLYYSYSTWGDPDPGIGFAISDKPEGPFTDKGKVFFSKEIGVDNSIDPVLFLDDGKLFLVWGSFHGIYGIQVSEDGVTTIGEKFRLGGNAYEGSFFYKRGKYYYYFGSTGTCCEGITSTYNVKVSRSTSFKGPYSDREGKSLLENGGSLFLERNEAANGFVGTGHNGDIIVDDVGDTWILYHAFDKIKSNKRVMLLDKIEWVNDWPVISNNKPTISEQPGPVFKK
jgi:arabinan endo-1,5-alpha-L-arabinosidase